MIICARVADLSAELAAEDSEQQPCVRCAELVWVSPSSVETAIREGLVALCLCRPCFDQLLATATILPRGTETSCATESCRASPTVRVFWPGSPAAYMCRECADRALTIATAMGFHLVTQDLDDPG